MDSQRRREKGMKNFVRQFRRLRNAERKCCLRQIQVPQQSSRSTCRSVHDRNKASQQRLQIFRHGRVVRYCIVFGPNSRKARERLINEGATLKFSKAIDIARRVETSKATLEMESTKQIGRVQNPNKLETRKCSDFGGKWHGKSTSFPAHGQKIPESQPLC